MGIWDTGRFGCDLAADYAPPCGPARPPKQPPDENPPSASGRRRPPPRDRAPQPLGTAELPAPARTSLNSRAALETHPYLRAATAGIRHHSRSLPAQDRPPADRVHLDAVHAHLTGLHQLLHQLAEATRPSHPAAGRHLAAAHTRLWQASTEIHSAFHLLPNATADSTDCRPEQLPEGPPVLTICQRHLAAGHVVRRSTTPSDLNTPLHGHTTCSQ